MAAAWPFPSRSPQTVSGSIFRSPNDWGAQPSFEFSLPGTSTRDVRAFCRGRSENSYCAPSLPAPGRARTKRIKIAHTGVAPRYMTYCLTPSLATTFARYSIISWPMSARAGPGKREAYSCIRSLHPDPRRGPGGLVRGQVERRQRAPARHRRAQRRLYLQEAKIVRKALRGMSRTLLPRPLPHRSRPLVRTAGGAARVRKPGRKVSKLVFGPPRLRLRLHLCIRPATPERAKHCVCCGSAPAGPLWTPLDPTLCGASARVPSLDPTTTECGIGLMVCAEVRLPNRKFCLQARGGTLRHGGGWVVEDRSNKTTIKYYLIYILYIFRVVSIPIHSNKDPFRESRPKKRAWR